MSMFLGGDQCVCFLVLVSFQFAVMFILWILIQYFYTSILFCLCNLFFSFLDRSSKYFLEKLRKKQKRPLRFAIFIRSTNAFSRLNHLTNLGCENSSYYGETNTFMFLAKFLTTPQPALAESRAAPLNKHGAPKGRPNAS